MINFFISIIIIIALLTSNAFSLNKLTTNQKLKETEQLLVEAANKISEGEIDAALMVVENLIDINPNFKLAHMIYGDLLLIQSHNYDQVSADTHKQYKKKIYDLKLELSRRIESFNNVDKNLIGAKIKVLLAKNIEYLIFIDVKSSRLFAFSNNEGNLEYISDYYMSVGKNGYGKKYEGHKKTPIGTYFIKNKITTKLPDLYGLGAYAINFPSVYDRLNNFTGSGIWIHGTPSSTYSRPPQSSDGCIVLSNNDINELAYILNKPGYRLK
jgi:murein L,D-transpeptidase YafK